ncbi:hypothetical protein TPADAL_0129a [Treponema pallidum subsp. pallidum DAL-1]|nr:hypothetical protein TPADAL_0129a [Treponema pallidum subsp. pallidum DAL-1]
MAMTAHDCASLVGRKKDGAQGTVGADCVNVEARLASQTCRGHCIRWWRHQAGKVRTGRAKTARASSKQEQTTARTAVRTKKLLLQPLLLVRSGAQEQDTRAHPLHTKNLVPRPSPSRSRSASRSRRHLIGRRRTCLSITKS